MNFDMFNAVKDFHEKFGQPVNTTPVLPNSEERALRIRLMREEVAEYLESEAEDDVVNIAKELADIIYIACGTALSYGYDLNAVFAEVHRSNMDKLGPDGKPIYRPDGKILKPDTWTKPDIKKVLDNGKV